MNTILWILQSLMAVAFLVPGIFKLIYSKEKLVEKGLTGVKGISRSLILFIGISEVLGAIGIIVPMLLKCSPQLTIVSAVGFALIMVAAAIVNYKNQDYKKIMPVAIIFLICVFIAYGRIALG